MLGFTRPLAMPDAPSAAAYASQCRWMVRNHSGSAWPSTHAAITRKPSTRSSSTRYETTLPSTAPTPKDATSTPAMRGLAPKRATTSTGTLMKNTVQPASPIANTGVHTRRSGSRARKRIPRRMPRSAPSEGSGLDRGTSPATSVAETR